MKKPTLLLLMGSLLFIATAKAQSTSNTVLKIDIPENHQFSTERLSRIDKVIEQYIDSNWIAGAIALVAKDGNIVYYKAAGYNDKENKKLLDKTAIFRIASQTKAITSTAIMMLYEEGKLLLDEPISKYIPEFKNPTVLDHFNAVDTTYTTIPAKREITIRDLLTHTSGIGYAQIGGPTMNAIYYKAAITGGIGLNNGLILANNIKKLAKLPLAHQPGDKFTYGLNTDVLGYLVEILSGSSLDQFFKERIFEPLGMKDTYFYIPEAKQNRLMVLQTEDKTHHTTKLPLIVQLNGDCFSNYPNLNQTYYSGGGGLSSTAYDYSIFMQMLLNGGEYNGKRLLSPATIRMMTTNQIGELYNNKNKFGLGFELVTEANYGKTPLSLGTFSWGGMFSSSYWIDPKEKIVAQFVLQVLHNSHGDIAEKFKTLVYQALQ